jgi:exopolysaccharide production protein ExoQ
MRQDLERAPPRRVAGESVQASSLDLARYPVGAAGYRPGRRGPTSGYGSGRLRRHVPAVPIQHRLMNWCIVLVLFWMSAPIAPLIPNLDDNLTTIYSIRSKAIGILAQDVDSELLRSLWTPVYLLILGIIVYERQLIWRCLTQHWLLPTLLAWAALSTLWSVSPDDTLRRSFALALCTVFGLYLGARVGTERTVRLLAAALAIGMVASVFCALAFPSVGISGQGGYIGAWRGVYANKNSLGGAMLKALVAFWFLYMIDKKGWHLAWLALAATLLLCSTAKTPVVVLVAIVITLLTARNVLQNPHRLGISLGFGISALALMFLLVVPLAHLLATLLERDLTLTGRTDIWILTWHVIKAQFWLGYGYSAFWSNPYGPATLIWDPLNWRVPNSHNGILELWLALGLVGVVLFAAFITTSSIAIFRESKRASQTEVMWWLTTTTMFLVYAVTESSSMEHNSVGWVLFVAVIAASGQPRTDSVRGDGRSRGAPWSSLRWRERGPALAGVARLRSGPDAV